MQVLNSRQVREALTQLPGWQRRGRALERCFEWKDFKEALRFVNRVGRLAERRQHHPDIVMRWNQVTLRLTTHDAGGITDKDLDLARRIDRLASRT